MKNRKAMAIPMTMIFMFFSQILYVAILSFNQIQATRYQGMIEFYEGQIQLIKARSLIEQPNKAKQLEPFISAIITKHSDSHLKRHPNMQVFYQEPQIQIYQNSNQTKFMLLLHQLFVSDEIEGNQEWQSHYQLSGTIDQKKLPVEFEQDVLLVKAEDFQRQLMEQGYQLKSQNRSGTQGNQLIQWEPFNQIEFNDGMIWAQKSEKQLTLLSQLNHQSVMFKEILQNPNYDYFVRSYCYIYQKND